MQFRKSLLEVRPAPLFPPSECSHRATEPLHILLQVIPVLRAKEANLQLRHNTAEHSAAGGHSGILALTAGSVALAAIPYHLESGFTSHSSIYGSQY
jgi:hypothetical protein